MNRASLAALVVVTSLAIAGATQGQEQTRTVLLSVVDAATGDPLPCRVSITDSDGVYHAPLGHVTHPAPTNWRVEHQLDVVSQGTEVFACLDDGRCEIELLSGREYRLRVVHGFEYTPLDITTQLPAGDDPLEVSLPLTRAVDMQALGWMSADTHVHDLTAAGCYYQARVEDLDYVNLMFIGPTSYIHTEGLLRDRPADVPGDDVIVWHGQELRDHQYGHLTLLGQSRPIEPVLAYTGTPPGPETVVTPLPNEPRNDEVWEMAQAQGALTAHAHATWWPGHGLAQTAALGALDSVEAGTPSLSSWPSEVYDVPVEGYESPGLFGDIWYRMLNCGVRTPLIGGTDKMSPGRVVGGTRVYAQVGEEWSHEGFMDAIRRGETFVTNGPLLTLTVDDEPIGSEVLSPDPLVVTARATLQTSFPVDRLEVLQNGQVIATRLVERTESYVSFEVEVEFERSGWIAVRVESDEKLEGWPWEGDCTAAHTSPTYVTIGGELPADRASAEYLIARLNASLDWLAESAVFSSEERRVDAVASFTEARSFYEDALARSE